MKKTIALGLSIVAVLIFATSPASAQTMQTQTQQTAQSGLPPNFKSEGFTIMPAYPNAVNPRQFIFEVRPGESVEDYVYVKNLSEETATFYIYGADPTFSAQGTPAYKTRQSGGNGEGKWIVFDQPQIDLKGGEMQKVKFSLSVPADAANGEYRIGVAMEKTKKDINNPNVTIATRVILHTKVTVTDNPQPVPKKGQEGAGEGQSPSTTPWQTYYFWVSLVLFITSFVALIWVTLSERKHVDMASDTKKISAARHPKSSKRAPAPKAKAPKAKKTLGKRKK